MKRPVTSRETATGSFRRTSNSHAADLVFVAFEEAEPVSALRAPAECLGAAGGGEEGGGGGGGGGELSGAFTLCSAAWPSTPPPWAIGSPASWAAAREANAKRTTSDNDNVALRAKGCDRGGIRREARRRILSALHSPQTGRIWPIQWAHPKGLKRPAPAAHGTPSSGGGALANPRRGMRRTVLLALVAALCVHNASAAFYSDKVNIIYRPLEAAGVGCAPTEPVQADGLLSRGRAAMTVCSPLGAHRPRVNPRPNSCIGMRDDALVEICCWEGRC
jgi:hypothetical protein